VSNLKPLAKVAIAPTHYTRHIAYCLL